MELLLVIGFIFLSLLLVFITYSKLQKNDNARAQENDAPAIAALPKNEHLAERNPVTPQASQAGIEAASSRALQTSDSLLAASDKSANAESSVDRISPATRALGEALALFAALIAGLGWAARKVIKKAQRERASDSTNP